MSERARAELALIAVTILWGASFVMIKSALEEVSNLLFLSMRFGVATLALVAVFRGRIFAKPELRAASFRGGVLAGLCLPVAYFFQTHGLRYTTPSKSAFITGLTTALVPFFAALVYRNVPHVSEVFGVVGATVGLALLTLPPGEFLLGYGDAITLCCTVAFALHILVLGRWSPVANFELLSTLQIAVTVLLILAALPTQTAYIRWSPAVVGAVLMTGIFNTAVAFSVMAWAQRHTSSTRVALIFAIEPVSAALMSYFVEGERLTARALTGAALILAGILFVELKPIGPVRHPQA
jgi:drug/metabolite transporter (DMT)-like permease